VNEISSVIMPYVEAHLQSLDPENIRDFLDVMLLEAKTNLDPNSCFSPNLGISTILNSMIDLFLAGMETTSSSLIFVFLHLLHHPDVQQKVHKEIDLVRLSILSI
jgi:cytochrome P450